MAQVNYAMNYYYDYTYDIFYGQWSGALQGVPVALDRMVSAQKDTSYYHLFYHNFGVKGLGSAKNDGTPTNILWANDSGLFKRSPFSSVVVPWGQLSGVPSSFAPSTHTHAYSALTGIPSTFTPSSHTHPPSEITQAAASSGQVLKWNGSIWAPGTDNGGSGTVSSVGVTSSDFSISGSPVTTSGSITLNLNISAPSVSNSIASGTAFQPRSGGSSMIAVNSSLSGVLGLTGTVTIAMCSTQNGTYTTVVSDGLVISILGLVADKSSGTIPVPAGWWAKVTYTGGTTGNYTRWDL